MAIYQHNNVNPAEVEAVENSFYKRSLINAFKGFLKGAAFVAAVGFVAGGLIASGILGGGVAGTLFPQASLGEMPFLIGGIKAALILGGIGGTIGATAGIQSTRDTRRFFLMHENRPLENTREPEICLVNEPPAPAKEKQFQEALAIRGEVEQTCQIR